MTTLTREQIEQLSAKAADAANDMDAKGYTSSVNISEFTLVCTPHVVQALCTLALQALAVQPRPISEAPKDGTPVFGFWRDYDGTPIGQKVFWHNGFREWISSFRRMTMADGFLVDGQTQKDHSPEVHHPTHFIPLTALPKPE